MRVPKTLTNAILLLFVSLIGIICWQVYKNSANINYSILVNIGAVFAWFLSSIFLGRYWYGYLKLTDDRNKK